VLSVDLVGSRRIWPAHVGDLVDPGRSNWSRQIAWMIKHLDSSTLDGKKSAQGSRRLWLPGPGATSSRVVPWRPVVPPGLA